MHHPRIPNRAAQADEPQGLEERTLPSLCPTRRQTRPRPLEEQAAQAPLFDDESYALPDRANPSSHLIPLIKPYTYDPCTEPDKGSGKSPERPPQT